MVTPNIPQGNSEREPSWWIAEYTFIWNELEPTFRKNFESRLRDEEKQQGPDNSVFGSAGSPRNVDVEHAHRVPDDNWETGLSWDDARTGLRFGVGARERYQDHPRWSDELEALLQHDWGKTYHPGLWQRVKRAVRHGFEHLRKEQT